MEKIYFVGISNFDFDFLVQCVLFITKSGIMTPLHGCAVLNESQGNF